VFSKQAKLKSLVVDDKMAKPKPLVVVDEMAMKELFEKASKTPQATHYMYMKLLKDVDGRVTKVTQEAVEKLTNCVKQHQKFTNSLESAVQLLPDIPAYTFDNQRKTYLDEAYRKFNKAADELQLHLEDLQRVDYKPFAARPSEIGRRRAQAIGMERTMEWAEEIRSQEKAAQNHLNEAIKEYRISIGAHAKAERKERLGRIGKGETEAMTPEETEEARVAQELKAEATNETLKKAQEKELLLERATDEKKRNERLRKAAEERAQATREEALDPAANVTKAVWRRTSENPHFKAHRNTVPDAEEGAQATQEEDFDSEVSDATKPVRKKKRRLSKPPGDPMPDAEEGAQATREDALDADVSDATKPVKRKSSKKPPVMSHGVTVPDAVLDIIPPTTDVVQSESATAYWDTVARFHRPASSGEDRDDPNAYLSSFMSAVGAAKEKSSTDSKGTAAGSRQINSGKDRHVVSPRVSAYLSTLKASQPIPSTIGWGGVTPPILPADPRNRRVFTPTFSGPSAVRKISVNENGKESPSEKEIPSEKEK
jgi:hypothetical protein